MSDTFPSSTKLFHALIEVEVHCFSFLHEMQRTQEYIQKSQVMKLERDLNYVEPPNDDDDAKTSTIVIRRREETRVNHEATYDRFDSYHRAERAFRAAVDSARVVVGEAGEELDRSNTPPLDRATTQIRFDLGQLMSAYPRPMIVGPWPPQEPLLVRDVFTAKGRIDVWIEKLRALIRPHAALQPKHGDGVATEATPPAYVQPQPDQAAPADATDRLRSVHPTTPPLMPKLSPDQLEQQAAALGPRLIGWEAILGALGGDTTRRRREQLTRLFKTTAAPVSWISRRPHAFKYQLLEWYCDRERAARAAAERRRDREAATSEYSERGGAHLQDLGAHEE